MDIYDVRRQLSNNKNIYELPLKVTFYARVSTEKMEQLNSLDNQVDYYRSYIKSNESWEFAEGYIDYDAIIGLNQKTF